MDLPNGLIPIELGPLVVNMVVQPLSTLASLLIIVAIYKAGAYQDSKFLFSVCLGDLSYSLSLFVMTVPDLAAGNFVWGKVGCGYFAGLTLISAASAILSLTWMTLNTWLIIIRRYYMSDTLKTGLIVGSWLGLIVSVCIVLQTDYILQGWHSRIINL